MNFVTLDQNFWYVNRPEPIYHIWKQDLIPNRICEAIDPNIIIAVIMARIMDNLLFAISCYKNQCYYKQLNVARLKGVKSYSFKGPKHRIILQIFCAVISCLMCHFMFQLFTFKYIEAYQT